MGGEEREKGERDRVSEEREREREREREVKEFLQLQESEFEVHNQFPSARNQSVTVMKSCTSTGAGLPPCTERVFQGCKSDRIVSLENYAHYSDV